MDIREKLNELRISGKIGCDSWVINNSIYICQMGSVAYNVSNDYSDRDIYGIVVPPKEIIFPHLSGFIEGFDKNINKFDIYTKDHIKDKDVEYDISIYNIVKYFRLLADNNPNIIDSIYVPDRCVYYIDSIGKKIRANRDKFLSKIVLDKLRGYAISQKKLLLKQIEETNKNYKFFVELGYNVKAGYHLVRILLQAEQILLEGTLDIEKNAKILRTIRNGEMSFDQITKWSDDKLNELENISANSSLRAVPDHDQIKNLLVESIENKIGNINVLTDTNITNNIIDDISNILEGYKERISN